MKRIIAIATILLMTVGAVNAQVKFGVKGGINITSMSGDASVFEASNRTGFYVGPTIKFNVPIVGLGVDLSALYDQREAKVDYVVSQSTQGSTTMTTTKTETISNKTIVIPLNVRYTLIGSESIVNLYAYTGPQVAFNVGSKKILDSTGSFKSSYFSWNLGLGAMIASHLQLNANYNIAMGKTGDVDEASTTSSINDAVSSIFSSDNNNSWQIGLTYYF